MVEVSSDASIDEVQSATEYATSRQIPLLVETDENGQAIESLLDDWDAAKVTKIETKPGSNVERDTEKVTFDLTYIMPTSPSAEQLSLVPTLKAGRVNVKFVSPGDEPQFAALDQSSTMVFSTDFSPTDKWLAHRNQELPGGGFRLFPDRRIVAFYGNPLTPTLGLLGEQSPQETVGRVNAQSQKYQSGEIPTVGGFELISTIATAAPGEDNTYSRKMEPDLLRPWIETAVENDFYVILDLQPGRTDFLTQAKIYEEFLRLPNVGLALDPEWRLKPDEVHLEQIGGVDADEVNSVVRFLTDLVREYNLPQKALILHQFKIPMLLNRDQILTPPELAVVVHVDGQGPLDSKYGTWDRMLSDPVGTNQNLWWAWKNFIDEDTPTATPTEVDQVEPRPVIVTYQ